MNNTISTQSVSTSTLSESSIFLEHSKPVVSSRIAEIDAILENIFSIEKCLSPITRHQVNNMQREMGKIHLKYSAKEIEISPLDALRLFHFQERIDVLYSAYEPTSKDFIYAEALIEERETLLA